MTTTSNEVNRRNALLELAAPTYPAGWSRAKFVEGEVTRTIHSASLAAAVRCASDDREARRAANRVLNVYLSCWRRRKHWAGLPPTRDPVELAKGVPTIGYGGWPEAGDAADGWEWGAWLNARAKFLEQRRAMFARFRLEYPWPIRKPKPVIGVDQPTESSLERPVEHRGHENRLDRVLEFELLQIRDLAKAYDPTRSRVTREGAIDRGSARAPTRSDLSLFRGRE
jgi:hypothetical protein